MAWNNLQQILSETINRHAPLINKRVKGKPAPWLNADVKAAMNHRDKLHRKFLKSKSNTDWNMYKTARNHETNIIRRAQKTHYKSVLRDSEKSPNKFWKMIKTMFPTKTRSHLPDHSRSMPSAQPTKNPLLAGFVPSSQK